VTEKKSETDGEEGQTCNTPGEALEYGYQKLSENPADDLLETAGSCRRQAGNSEICRCPARTESG
jgi:hypothetical protein